MYRNCIFLTFWHIFYSLTSSLTFIATNFITSSMQPISRKRPPILAANFFRSGLSVQYAYGGQPVCSSGGFSRHPHAWFCHLCMKLVPVFQGSWRRNPETLEYCEKKFQISRLRIGGAGPATQFFCHFHSHLPLKPPGKTNTIICG